MSGADRNSDVAKLEERLMALEVKASFAEDLADVLNDTVARQQQQLESLARELVRLRRQVADMGEAEGTLGAPGQEMPPHY